MKELKISEYSFHEFLQSFQTAVIDGYRLDLDSNERFPQKYGSHMEVTLVVPEDAFVGESDEGLDKVVFQSPVTEVPVEVSQEQPVKTRKGK